MSFMISGVFSRIESESIQGDFLFSDSGSVFLEKVLVFDQTRAHLFGPAWRVLFGEFEAVLRARRRDFENTLDFGQLLQDQSLKDIQIYWYSSLRRCRRTSLIDGGAILRWDSSHAARIETRVGAVHH
ncbi:hypothetical protein AKJ16_DCAP13735 [Drosera capensis]